MIIRNRSFALASAIAIALSVGAAPALAGDTSPEISNARMESQIWTTYALSPYLRSSEIEVSVIDGKATLTGVVEEDVNKDLAEQIARGVDGVSDVDNQIAVKPDYRPTAPSGERRYGARVQDASTTAAVLAKLSWSQHADDDSIEVSTVDGKVTLKGEAESAEDKAAITRLARNTPGVDSVDNRMVTVDSSQMEDDDAEDSTLAESISDTWITTKVKSTFMYSSNVNSSDISVSTSDGVVTLTGSVASGSERALAVELAKSVRGVKSVTSTALEFTPLEEVASATVPR